LKVALNTITTPLETYGVLYRRTTQYQNYPIPKLDQWKLNILAALMRIQSDYYLTSRWKDKKNTKTARWVQY